MNDLRPCFIGYYKNYNLSKSYLNAIRNKSTKKLIPVRKVDLSLERVKTKASPQLANSDNISYAENYVLQLSGGEVFLSKEYWSEGIALLCINHPEKQNSITGKMMVDLRKCVLELEHWKAGKGFILYGKGANFSSGGIQDFARLAATPTNGICFSVYMLDILKRLKKLPLISVSLVHGNNVGGGAELSTYADFIIVAENAKLSFNNGKFGLITAWGAATRLAQLVGERKALEILLSSKIYTSQDCFDIGLASKIVDTSNRIQEAMKFLKNFTTYSSSVIQSYKNISTKFSNRNFEDSLQIENEEFIDRWTLEMKRTK